MCLLYSPTCCTKVSGKNLELFECFVSVIKGCKTSLQFGGNLRTDPEHVREHGACIGWYLRTRCAHARELKKFFLNIDLRLLLI